MKDPVEEFERMRKITESFLDDFNGRLKKTLNVGYKPNPNIQHLMSKHANDLESGAECKGISKGPNKLFFSQVGDIGAVIGQNRNKIEDIGGLNISKRDLRCYDLTKDKYGIAWLFDDNAKYHAKKIWGGPNDIHFEGEWSGGVFKGVWHGPDSNWKTAPANYQGTGLGAAAAQVNPTVVNYTVLSKGKPVQRTTQQIIKLLMLKKINSMTQIYRPGINTTNSYVFLHQLPEYAQLQAAATELVNKRIAPAPPIV